MWKKFVDIPLLVFLFFSIFYLAKNLFWGSNGYKTLHEYEKSIEKLRELLEKEKIRNENLKQTLYFVETYKNETLKAFIRDYLWKVEKGESVFLNKKEH
jgi:cell division protein FtsB